MAPGPAPWPFMLKIPGAKGDKFTVTGVLVWLAEVAVRDAWDCPVSSHGICRLTWVLEV